MVAIGEVTFCIAILRRRQGNKINLKSSQTVKIGQGVFKPVLNDETALYAALPSIFASQSLRSHGRPQSK